MLILFFSYLVFIVLDTPKYSFWVELMAPNGISAAMCEKCEMESGSDLTRTVSSAILTSFILKFRKILQKYQIVAE